MRESLAHIARRVCAHADATSKSLEYYASYDRYLGDARDDVVLMELGVHTGESLKVWATYFPGGTIIGVDVLDHGTDFSGHANIIFEQADQADAERLSAICLSHAPNGLDIVIDDASHIAQNSAASYAILFPLLKRGGLYVIEDWGTGYFEDWPDGNRLNKTRYETFADEITKRFPSHDFGMVGFVKSLVDEIASDKHALQGVPTKPGPVAYVHVNTNIVVVKKA